MTQALEPGVASTTMICVIPTAPAFADDLSLQRIYDDQPQYLGTVRRRPTHTDLTQMAVLRGFRPALQGVRVPVDEPVRATRRPDRR